MSRRFAIRLAALLTFGLGLLRAVAQTDGAARMAVTINDYDGSGASR